MLKLLLHLVCSILNWLDFLETHCLYFYIKIDIHFFLSISYVIPLLSFLLYSLYLFFSASFYGFLLYYSILKNSTILVFLSLCLKSFIIFIIIVSIRIATPRFKIESLTKIGWLYCLLFILVCLLLYVAGYFFF